MAIRASYFTTFKIFRVVHKALVAIVDKWQQTQCIAHNNDLNYNSILIDL